MWIVLFLSIILLIPVFIVGLLGKKEIVERYIYIVTTYWSRHLIFSSGSKVNISGLENIPGDKSFLLVANHQSNFDIAIILAYIPVKLGFIGKYEMLKVPFLSTWMKSLNCVFIKRKNLRDSITGIQKALDNVNKGQTMVLFPEGTRSRDGKIGKFHKAGLELAIKENVILLPFSIMNSCEMFEKHNRINPVTVQVIIDKPKEYKAEESKTGAEEIAGIIEKNLSKGWS